MISVIVTVEPTRGSNTKLTEIYAWLGTHVVDHWALDRLTVDKIKVDFFGLDQEQHIVAFKLKFGGA